MVYDEELNVIGCPDMTRGRTVPAMTTVHHDWVGGRWVTTYNGRVIDYDGELPEGIEREPFDQDWYHLSYVPYTEEELRRKEAEEAEAARRAELEAWLDGAPDQAADLDEAVVELYEAQTRTQLETDEALTALYETILSMNGGD